MSEVSPPVARSAAGTPRHASAVSRDNIEDLYALSPVQQGMLFHALLAPGTSPYLEQGVWTLPGAVDLERFERAWNLLIERHPVLRTVFHEARKQPIQIVLKRLPISFSVCDLRALPSDLHRAACAAFLADDLRRPIDPRTGPLMRAAFLRLSGEETRFVFTFDHAILDGWSLRPLCTDLLAIYDALTLGVEPAATDAPPYKDFVVWLSRWNRREALDFWTRYLAGFQTPTPLPVDRRSTGRRSLASLVHPLAESTSRELAALARKRRVTLGALVQAAWAVVLSRYGGGETPVFGLTVSGRPPELPGSDRMIGPFINTLPVRVQLDEGAEFLDLPRALMQQYADLSRHGYLSLPDIQSRSEIPPPSKLFDSILIFHNEAISKSFSSPHLRLIAEDASIERTSYDLTIDVLPGRQMQARLSYVQEAFDPATVERLAASFERLLEGVVARPEARLGVLEVLSAAERARLLVELNRTGEEPAFALGFPAAFARQVAARPEAVAAVCGAERVSYAGLAARAHRVAEWLRQRGAGREVRVGVLGERGIGMLSTIVGILEVGAAWVPLEPAHPDARLAAILENSGVGFVATQGKLASRVRELIGGPVPAPVVFCWDEPPVEGPAAENAAIPGTEATAAAEAQALANVFYTSGSTGVPKGAMVEQAGMLNHLWAKIALLGLGPASVVVQNASHGFDISVWQMLAPLLVGGWVLIVDDETALDPELLLAAVERSGATVLETVPTLLEALVGATGEEISLSGLRYLISNAETLPVGLCRRWLERFPRVPLINTYGATECSDDVTHQIFLTAPSAESERVGVGRPIPGLRIYVVDHRLQPAPLGCGGQIAVAGVGVGRGYLGSPEKTAATFVPDPFGGAGERLYLSGDLGRWTEEGELEVLGRLDSQLKVRGHRVELGEVEAALARHPAVRQGVVVARPDGQGGNRLVAYLVAEGEPSAAELHGFLERMLPRPMLPEHFVQLAALPLNRNGKIDRRALPEPAAAARRSCTAPRNELEAVVAGIWQSVLGIERVGVHDDFFELGGHSLKTIQVRSRLKHQLGVELPLRSLFDQPTVAQLAAEVGRVQILEVGRAAQGSIPRLPDAEGYALSHAQRRLWLWQQVEPGDVSYNMPVLYRLAGHLDAGALCHAFRELVERHAGLRTCFAVVDGEPVQRIAPRPTCGLDVIDLSGLAGEAQNAAVQAVVRGDARTAFDLRIVPVRARLLALAADRHLFLLTLHHILTDAWSWQRLSRDLLELYEAFAVGLANPLPPLAIRYVDFAAWQNGRIRHGELASAERYWLQQLQGELPALELPADHARPAAPSLKGGQASARLGDGLVEGLRRLAREHDLTLFMTLLAAATAFLSRLTGQTDMVLGTPSAGRDQVGIEGVVGFFVNMLALRTDLTGDPGFLELLARCRQTSLDAYAHQEYPFDLLIQKLNPIRELGRSPVFSVTFAFNEAAPVTPTGSLALEPQNIQAEQAMPFDLSLAVWGTDAELSCSLIYSLDLFVPETVERWLRRFQILLRGAVAEPKLRLSELPLWTPEECTELTLQRLATGAIHPLSFPQRDIWFQCQLHPGTSHYNCCLEVELRGPLEPAVLWRALQAVVDRHDGLRASFPAVDGQPVQRIAAALAAECAPLDLSASEAERRLEQLGGWRAGLAGAPFNLEAGPLFRFGLARLGPGEFRLLLVIHHLVVDAVNLVLFVEQTLRAYDGYRRGEEAPLPALPVHYPDFAAWQGRQLRLGALAVQRHYWRRRLRGGLPGLELPADRPRPLQRSFAAGEVVRRLAPGRLQALKRLRTELGSSLFRTVLSALDLVFYRLTGETDLVVATPVSIRPVALGDVAGYFANALPLRTDLRGDPSFRQLAGRVDEAVRGAILHGNYPIDEAIGSLKLERDASRPLLPICISQVRSLDCRCGELSVRSSDPWSPGVVFDLWVLLGESSAGLEIQLKYNRDLFDPSTIERLADGLDSVLAGAASQPEARLSELEILTSAERQRLLAGFSRGTAWRSQDVCAHRQIARRARERPWAEAAVCGAERISYGEINSRANRVAHWLRSRGVGCEDRVALFAQRGIGLLATMLGVLKCGAAFLPLDPDSPDARLRSILSSAGVRAIASQGSLAERSLDLAATAPSQPAVFCFDEAPAALGLSDSRSLAAQPDWDPDCVERPESLACIFFTSGSTGVPKGAMVEQRGMLNHLFAKIELLELGEASSVVQNASHGFDISVWQSLAALLVGGRVLIYDDATASDPEALLAALERDGATVVETIPRFLETMLDVAVPGGGPPITLPRLEYLVSNAETLGVALCRRWFERFPRVALINTYGATECSDDTTHHVMRAPPAADASRVAVGEPIPGFAIYVVDDHLRLLPCGWPGQIVMAGVGVGRGYVGDPEKTARAFVPDPFAGLAGSRLYLTGDLGRWTEEGVLEFLGRRDHQVKIRGFRIELGEIEAALGRHPAVAEAVVTVRDTQRLVAYAVPRPGQLCEVADLRRSLAETLPEPMVPGVFVLLAALPRTPTGKVDRRSLPEPGEPAAGDGGGFFAPRTPAEEALAAIWAGVLGLGRIGIHDRFFDLGGDSILSIQVVSRAREAGLEIAPRQLFQHQTVAELAAVARPAAASAADGSNVEGAVPLTPIEHWFFAQGNPRPQHWNMGLVFEVTEPMEARLLEAAWLRLVDHHDALRLRFVHECSGWQQWNAGAETRRFFSHVDFAGLPAGERGAALTEQAGELQRSLDLAAGPLLRVAYFDYGPRDLSRLVVIIHHLAVDVVSWRLLIEDLLQAYAQLRRGEAVRLTAKTTSFKRWSRRLSTYARSAELRQELAYWLDQRGTSPGSPDSPASSASEESGRLAVSLGPEETGLLLRDLAAVHGTSIEGILLAALTEATSRLTGSRALLVELAGHGRQEVVAGVDLTRTVGWFTCAYPLLIDLRPAATIEEAVRCAGETLRRVPNGGIGHGLLRYLSGDPEVAAQLAALPRATVSFEYLGQVDGGLPPSCPLRLAAESAGPPMSSEAVTTRLLEVEAKVRSGCLEIVFGYGERRFEHSTVDTLAQDLLAVLRSLIGRHRTSTAARLSRSGTASAPRTLPELLAAQAAAAPAEPFVLWGDGEELTFAGLDLAARRFAAGLRKLGVARGERVAILLENRPEFLAAMFGSVLAGAVYAAINTHLTPEEAGYIVAHVGAAVMVTEPRHFPLAAAIRSVCPELRVVISAAELLSDPIDPIDPASVDVEPGDLATIQYTSGTTALPKGVMLTHQALLAAVRERARHLRYSSADTMLVPNPLFHLNGQGSIIGCLAVGARVVLREKFSASGFWEDVERHRVTTLNGMQTIPRILLAREPRPGGDRGSSLETVIGVLSAELHRAFEDRFGVRFVQVYSLTEDPMSVIGPRDGLPAEWSAKLGAAGLPLAPETHRVRIVDDDGRDLPAGTPGEIVKRSPAMMTGYFRDPMATALALRDGWLYTGDYGVLDEDGFLSFVGRKKDAIRRSGEMISAAEVETVIASHPGIAEAAVVGVPDPIRSEEVKAFVVLADGYDETSLSPERILAHCAERLAAFKIPRFLEYRRDLPKTATLKIRKQILRDADAAGSVGGFDRLKPAAAAPGTAALSELSELSELSD